MIDDEPVQRPLGALDLDRAARLHREAFVPLGERGWTRQDIAGLLASPGTAGFLLEAKSGDVGMAICRVAADEAELLTVAVSPRHRRRGAGRRLLAAVIEQVHLAGARTLFLEVGVDNPAARALYDSLGFVVAGRRAGYYARVDGPPADAVIMRLTLN
ncbi:MAG: GNAT family N-acetyltransferase [Alphaproteobacteria bacterium]|jgi:ribosomal-protein-alanine N-acetyltransferase|nr:GNAT family N-acetyltransferase [Alphaproteobacteria bacterium]